MFKKLFLSGLVISCMTFSLFAQEEDENKKSEGYQFTDVITLDVSPIKNQYRSGTCWAFSGLAVLETEVIKKGKPAVDLSEMWIVRKSFEEKAIRYVRLHGNCNFPTGGAVDDCIHVMDKYGLMPEEAYPGLHYGTDKHVHGELDIILKNFLDGVIANKNRELSTVWFDAYKGILDAYLGPVPETFTYEGVEYTPRTFADNYIGLKGDDFKLISSYTHHPFYTPFILEIEDNWRWASVWNVTMDEMIEIIDYALNNGHSIGWGSDVSEKGFSWKKGVAIIPDLKLEDLQGTEKSRWEKLTPEERSKAMLSFEEVVPELIVTQEMRQIAFDNYQTTDDHGMEIIGIAKDQNGNKFYKVKNSWGSEGHIYEGFFYASETFVKYKTMDFMVNKNGIPKQIRKKLK